MFDKNSVNERFILSVSYIMENNIATKKNEVANALGISPGRFSEILSRRMNAGIEILAIFCSKYGFSVEWMIYGAGEMFKKEHDIPLLKEPETDYKRGENPKNVQFGDKNGIYTEYLKQALDDKQKIIDLLEEQNSFLKSQLKKPQKSN